MKLKLVVVALAAACVLTRAASAQETATTQGQFSQEGSVELTWNHVHDDVSDIDTLTAKGSYAPTLRLTDRLTAQALVTLWPWATPAKDNVLDGESAFIEEIKLHYAGDNFSLYGGKFDPAFGSAFNLAPGIYGAEIGQTYQTVEKVGVGGDVKLPVAGEHILSAAVFTNDRTILSESIGWRRPRLHLADGGPGNTKGLESFAVSLDGAMDNGFGYSLGYRDIAAALSGDANERGVVAGVNFKHGEDGALQTQALAEVASLDNADGVDGARRTFYTVGGTLSKGEWHAMAVASGSSDNDVAGGGDLNRFEIGVGRDLGHALTVDAGVQFVDRDGDRSTVFGLRLTFGFGGKK